MGLLLDLGFQGPQPFIQIAPDLDEQVIGAHVVQCFCLVGCGAGAGSQLRYLIKALCALPGVGIVPTRARYL